MIHVSQYTTRKPVRCKLFFLFLLQIYAHASFVIASDLRNQSLNCTVPLWSKCTSLCYTLCSMCIKKSGIFQKRLTHSDFAIKWSHTSNSHNAFSFPKEYISTYLKILVLTIIKPSPKNRIYNRVLVLYLIFGAVFVDNWFLIWLSGQFVNCIINSRRSSSVVLCSALFPQSKTVTGLSVWRFACSFWVYWISTRQKQTIGGRWVGYFKLSLSVSMFLSLYVSHIMSWRYVQASWNRLWWPHAGGSGNAVFLVVTLCFIFLLFDNRDPCEEK